ncbi:RNA-directed DNA polymerase [Escherichia albertii]|uniref:antiviral reverse transcriptase Drt4 n=1 Tax=Escherichia albertii TaxID=208962 RepID=UPI0010F44BD4|nr:antiviral reverse transcriptase Drt4 [Escherichia albertii]QSZ86367.1 RNA-directed DNA polymerase [Escherichia albertii]QSZ90752.1 RNA-directed DNA polymerase [Escherichia albertii]QSZ95157.1 RNA-directed DNA polymerase [Escherichia albertii]QSZ99547.1 RNA-directed DNA polymerase [Escherichia albertii]QTA03936.1 RNA-directed DNA polymerase [Escherichia albertii]
MIFDEKRHLYEALLRHNYFPNQKGTISEIPPCFSSRTFTPEICELIVSNEPGKRKLQGYDCVEYSSTRYNNFPRVLSLIHPRAYAQLAKHLYESWDEIRKIKENKNSMIKPEMHPDGRLFIMNYEDAETRTVRELNDGFGRRFKVKTDIAGCFNNIYSHSIPWAVVGVNKAKTSMNKHKNSQDVHWSDRLDYYQRQTRRGETHGVPVGPATSSIVCEIILSSIDNILENKGFLFRRYIDDYTCYCKTHDEAKEFLHVLGTELSKLKLSLNLHKTKITSLPSTLNDDWVSLLSINSPSKRVFRNNDSDILSASEVISFLDYAVQLHLTNGGGSILKYAISLIINKVDEASAREMYDYVLNLSWHYPILIPYLDVLHPKININDEVRLKLNEVLNSCIDNKFSDGMAWVLYYCLKYSIDIDSCLISKIFENGDCLSICILDKTGRYDKEIEEFSKNIVSLDYLYEVDKYWILFYQRFYSGKGYNPYNDDCCFDIMKTYGVNFMPDDGYQTRAEHYCNIVNSPFLENDEQVISFNDYCS